jgi:hypothetical protein
MQHFCLYLTFCQQYSSFSPPHVIQTGYGAHIASYLMYIGVLSPGREADHLPPDNAEVVDLYIHFPICLHDVELN